MILATILAFFSMIMMAMASDVLLPRQTNTTPLLFFNSIQQLTACASGSLSWIYVGPADAVMTLQITNNGVTQESSTFSSLQRTLTDAATGRAVPTGASPSSTTVTLSTSITPSNSNSFNWTQVTLPQGAYIAISSFPAFQYNARSLPFVIQESTDTTCFSTSTSSMPPSTASSTSSSPSATVLVSTPSSMNKGAIAGGVVGGAVFLLCVLALFLFFRYKRSTHIPSSSYTGGGGAIFGMRRKGWGGLSSYDSSKGIATDVPQRKRSKLRRPPKPYLDGGRNIRQLSHTDSLGSPTVDVPIEEGIPSYRSANAFSPSEEKFASSEEIVGMATLPANGGKRQSSLSESFYNEFSSSGSAMGPRRPSVNSTASLLPGARRPSIDSPAPAYSSPTSASSPNVAAIPPGMDRAPSGTSSQQEKKKTPRKPVPVYVPSSSTPPPAIATDPSISTPTPLFAPSAPFAEAELKAQKRSSGHYALPSRAEPQLSHKSSFGPGGVEGKPLHYLIPDMPHSVPS